MKEFASIGDLVKYLDKNISSYQEKEEVFLKEEMEFLKKLSQEKIGHQQLDWAPLSPATMADKAKKGYLFAGDGNPLFIDGTLRDSIEAVVEVHRGAIGSKLDIALWQEEGTPDAKHPIPPRSFLGSTMFENLPQIGRSLKMFMGSFVGSSERQVISHD